MKLLVRNLARNTTEQEIRVLFSAFGTVKQCDLVLDQETGLSKGFAFVEMPEKSEGIAAIAGLNQTEVANNKIRVKSANQ
ncbi:RNA recognition motif domain-containing protein [Vibrio sp. VB16]|jgi:RNA recognition motif-containing protein|uniref:RNA recognition motif domain-containing protein n=1 Tax=Vibrio sp. VB16 TaxID=2785746 RepID=UPI00189F1CCA|nr:RNA-binding protein [Vibrio sp. VB16]UGA56792.1 RNA-binding protein [Vibrio sp. VB16]